MSSLRVVQVNLAFHPAAATADALLDRYQTLTGWSAAVARAGASVAVVQRFGSSHRLTRDDVMYEIVADRGAACPAPAWSSDPVVRAVVALDPDVIHINGLMFPAMTGALGRAVSSRTAIVLQDHAGFRPPPMQTWLDRWRARRWAADLGRVDAWSFTSAEHAHGWRESGLLGDARVLEIIEASTTLQPQPQDEARRLTGVGGTPAVLWVGRLNDNKDPLTAVAGMQAFMRQAPGARAWMIYQGGPLEPRVRQQVERCPIMRDRVMLVGAVPHDAVAQWMSAADLFVSASRHEGSGYALIEAVACGLVPVVTDIPSFRVIAGLCGVRWPAGDPVALAGALAAAAGRDFPAERARVRDHFTRALSWDVIGRHTVDRYREIVEHRRTGARG